MTELQAPQLLKNKDSLPDCQPLAAQEIIERIEKHAETVPYMFRSLFKRVFKLNSPTQAIKAKCQECVGYEEVFARVNECKSYRCPLWTYRPYQDKNDQELEGRDALIEELDKPVSAEQPPGETL